MFCVVKFACSGAVSPARDSVPIMPAQARTFAFFCHRAGSFFSAVVLSSVSVGIWGAV